eukprot:TRINITY_DN9576_c1_g1_i1.p1 TRINITY_DN9576_c1_g1~~TRINITY_DN9576_c1_g1_i1.p1  ORF type:complete len:117 (+),score=21.32 TRINITY_DN9576_c1_g1_i1:46-396(+)
MHVDGTFFKKDYVPVVIFGNCHILFVKNPSVNGDPILSFLILDLDPGIFTGLKYFILVFLGTKLHPCTVSQLWPLPNIFSSPNILNFKYKITCSRSQKVLPKVPFPSFETLPIILL